ncbi:MAG: aspartate 1-decarboxylase [Armatimonadetes bacterium]|nr:aspartate 1-decarboxylase [Armatimonadota bacterium]
MKLLTLLKSKIHHARVTYANPDYVGSVEMCSEVMAAVGLLDGEFVYVWNVENGERFTTYAFAGPKGECGVNGAAAHRVKVGDRLIIASFAFTDEDMVPKIVILDEKNEIVKPLKPFSRTGD